MSLTFIVECNQSRVISVGQCRNVDFVAQHPYSRSCRNAAATKRRKSSEPSCQLAVAGFDAEQLGPRHRLDHLRMSLRIWWHRQMVPGAQCVAAAGANVFELLPRAQHLPDRLNRIGKNSIAFQSETFGNGIELQWSNFKSHYTILCISQLHSYAGDFVVTTILSTVLYLTLEEPILVIESYIYKQIAARTTKESNRVRN